MTVVYTADFGNNNIEVIGTSIKTLANATKKNPRLLGKRIFRFEKKDGVLFIDRYIIEDRGFEVVLVKKNLQGTFGKVVSLPKKSIKNIALVITKAIIDDYKLAQVQNYKDFEIREKVKGQFTQLKKKLRINDPADRKIITGFRELDDKKRKVDIKKIRTRL